MHNRRNLLAVRRSYNAAVFSFRTRIALSRSDGRPPGHPHLASVKKLTLDDDPQPPPEDPVADTPTPHPAPSLQAVDPWTRDEFPTAVRARIQNAPLSLDESDERFVESVVKEVTRMSCIKRHPHVSRQALHDFTVMLLHGVGRGALGVYLTQALRHFVAQWRTTGTRDGTPLRRKRLLQEAYAVHEEQCYTLIAMVDRCIADQTLLRERLRDYYSACHAAVPGNASRRCVIVFRHRPDGRPFIVAVQSRSEYDRRRQRRDRGRSHRVADGRPQERLPRLPL